MKVHNRASLLTFLEVCKFTTFVTERVLTYDRGLHSESVQAIKKHTMIEILITSVHVYNW